MRNAATRNLAGLHLGRTPRRVIARMDFRPGSPSHRPKPDPKSRARPRTRRVSPMRTALRWRSPSAPRDSQTADSVPQAMWGEAAKYYDERGLAALLLHIAMTNVFNRRNVFTRQVAGAGGA